MVNRGRCRCGGIMVKDWGGIAPQYTCNKCGIILSTSGRHERQYLNNTNSKPFIDRAWDLLTRRTGQQMLLKSRLLERVRYMSGISIPVTDKQIELAGYKIVEDYITKQESILHV